MHRVHSLRFLQAVALLVAGVSACTKDDDPYANVPPAASYTLNGRVVTCQPAAAVGRSGNYDNLALTLTTVPQPGYGSEVLVLKFQKRGYETNSDYELAPEDNFGIYSNVGNGAMFFTRTTAAYKARKNSIAGTFSGEARNYHPDGTYTVYSRVSSGTFNVPLE